MVQKNNPKKYKAVLIALAAVVVVLLLSALIGDKISTVNNLKALNEAITNTSALTAGSATGYTLNYPEKSPDTFSKASRKMIFTKNENGYTFHEVTTDENSGNIYSELFGKPGEYYTIVDGNPTKKDVPVDTRATPYSFTWLGTTVGSQQIKSIKKIDREGKTGYTVNYNRQWLVGSYQGYGTPVNGVITYMIDEADGKPIIASLVQALSATAKNQEGKAEVRVVEEVIYLHALTTEDGKSPAVVLEEYYQDNIKDKWTLEKKVEQTETPPETVGDSK